MKRLKKSKIVSAKRPLRKSTRIKPDYPLQGSSLDLPLSTVLAFAKTQRSAFIAELVKALRKEVKSDTMSLKRRTPFAVEMRDLRRLFYAPADQYLFTDERNGKRWVLGKGSPGSTHVYWSRNNIWKMKTKGGSLQQQITQQAPVLIKTLEKLLDPDVKSKRTFRNPKHTVVQNVLKYLEFDRGAGCAFPPFHAKFFADRFLPTDEDRIVFDPCCGWGGRLLGSLLVNRPHRVQYIGCDPEERNREAYEGLTRRATVWLEKEIKGTRDSTIYYEPFEDWIAGANAKKLFGKVDLILTSPPYFSAENYNPTNPDQSANRYDDYLAWRENFYRVLFKGAYRLLKPEGRFVLNIADVAEAPKLERDARRLAADEGFISGGFFKLAMSLTPASRKAGNARHVVQVNGKQFKYEPVFVFKKKTSSS